MWLMVPLVIFLLVDVAQACAEVDSSRDSYDEICSDGYYMDWPSDCGYFDDDDFTAHVQCCACGGGASASKACVNDDSSEDPDGYNCSASGGYYYEIPSACGYYDDEDFTAEVQCCSCGGGEGTTCDYGKQACRTAALALGFQLGNVNLSFAGNYPDTGCFAFKYGQLGGTAFYGLLDDGGEVQSESELSKMRAPKFRLPRTYNCDKAATHGGPGRPTQGQACVNNDDTSDAYDQVCSDGYYRDWPSECGYIDDNDFSANVQCCDCGGGVMVSQACTDDDSTLDAYDEACSDGYYSDWPSDCGYFDDNDFNADKQCCACGGGSSESQVATPGSTPKACTNDDRTMDSYGKACSYGYYADWPSDCGYFDDNDFTADKQCCSCGGGLSESQAATPGSIPKECTDVDSTKDSYGEVCSGGYYIDWPSSCGDYDDDDFTAHLQCCSCGGGSSGSQVGHDMGAPTPAPTPKPTPASKPAEDAAGAGEAMADDAADRGKAKPPADSKDPEAPTPAPTPACWAQPYCNSANDLTSTAGACKMHTSADWTNSCNCIDTIVLKNGCVMELASGQDGSGKVWGPFMNSIAVFDEGIGYDIVRSIKVYPEATPAPTQRGPIAAGVPNDVQPIRLSFAVAAAAGAPLLIAAV